MGGRAVAFGTCVGALLASCSGAWAAADGLRFGPLTAFPSLVASERRDDNIYLASGEGTEDWITTVTPALRLTLPMQRFLLQADAALDIVRYADASAEDSTSWSAGAALRADFPGGLYGEVGGNYRETYLTTSQEFGPGEDSSLGTLRAVVGYRIGQGSRVELGWSGDDYLFDLSADRERSERMVRGAFFWQFRPRWSALFELARTDIAYDSNEPQDSSETQATAGVTWEITERSTGLVKAGYEWKRFDQERPDLGYEDASYVTVSGALRHAITDRTAAAVELRRGSHESDFPQNPYYVRTGFSAGLSHRFTWRLFGRAGVRYDRDAYPNEVAYTNPYDPARPTDSGRRSDTLTGLTAALGFDLARWLTLELEYGRDRRTSNFETFAYTANAVTLRARAAF